MTNEELALRIQNGEQSLMEALWNNVERLVAWHARKIIAVLQGSVAELCEPTYAHRR